jgi:outer membrane protein TolC
VATADLYPKLQLFGTIGFEPVSSKDFLEWSSRAWSFSPNISWNFFDAGAIRQNIKVQTDRQADLLARDRYQAGLVDFNTVLNTQLSLLAFQDELVQSDGAVTTNLVRLYKALGGGRQFYEAAVHKSMKRQRNNRR